MAEPPGRAGPAQGEGPPWDRFVAFPAVDGRRSTSRLGRAVVADALRVVDPVGARAAEGETRWRTGYPTHFRRLVEAGVEGRDAAVAIARAGLGALHARMRWAGAGGDEPMDAAFGTDARAVETVIVDGAAPREREPVVPWRGRVLQAGDVRRRLSAWLNAGIVDPTCREAIDRVLADPDWLDLRDVTVVALGAAAEMGPVPWLLRWGADVVAIDRPGRDVWAPLLAAARKGAGRMIVPMDPAGGPPADRAGIDLLTEPSTAAAWLASMPAGDVLGNYVHAEGALGVRVSTAADALTVQLQRQRPALTLAFLLSPTDTFAVPAEAVRLSARAWESSRVSRLVRGPMGTLTGGRLLKRNYVPGVDPGINDSIVVQQGSNYLLAQRIRRWRATEARAGGGTVSAHVAPPTRTRSVVGNRPLAAAYVGAHRFGIEVFDPETARALMALLLVHDVRAGRPAAAEPWQDEAYAAVHGGLWTTAYQPRSALGLAALLGLGRG